MAKFRQGNIITLDGVYHTILFTTKDNYKLSNGQWMPCKIVDAYWARVEDEESEIIE